VELSWPWHPKIDVFIVLISVRSAAGRSCGVIKIEQLSWATVQKAFLANFSHHSNEYEKDQAAAYICTMSFFIWTISEVLV